MIVNKTNLLFSCPYFIIIFLTLKFVKFEISLFFYFNFKFYCFHFFISWFQYFNFNFFSFFQSPVSIVSQCFNSMGNNPIYIWWMSIMALQVLIKNGLARRIGNGHSTDPWFSHDFRVKVTCMCIQEVVPFRAKW